MATPNNLTSNTNEKLANVFLEGFEASRMLCKAMDTQLIQERLTPSSGGQVSVKRPHDYKAIRTPDGNLSGQDPSSITAGKATATVQDYITVWSKWENIEEALELEQLKQILAPMSKRAATELETSLANYMLRNANLSVGTPGTAVTKWSDVAAAGALMNSMGIPMDNEIYYAMNPYANVALADTQSDRASGDDKLVNTAWKDAQISKNFGGLRAITCNTLQTIADDATLVDRSGTLAANPIVTYLAAKDSMLQSFSLAGFTANAQIVAGSTIEITGRHYLNQSTRTPFSNASGSLVKYRATVTETVTLSGTGTGNIIVAGPAISEVNGQYNTVDSPPVSGDVVTVLGAAGGTYQPNLFFHKQAFGMGTVKLPPLAAQDSTVATYDGISFRVTRYSDGTANRQMIRFDLLPAFITFNPFFAGLAYGTA